MQVFTSGDNYIKSTGVDLPRDQEGEERGQKMVSASAPGAQPFLGSGTVMGFLCQGLQGREAPV